MNHILPNEPNLYDDGILRVSAKSETGSMAGAIAGIMRERDYVELRAVGPNAVYQAVKAVYTESAEESQSYTEFFLSALCGPP